MVTLTTIKVLNRFKMKTLGFVARLGAENSGIERLQLRQFPARWEAG